MSHPRGFSFINRQTAAAREKRLRPRPVHVRPASVSLNSVVRPAAGSLPLSFLTAHPRQRRRERLAAEDAPFMRRLGILVTGIAPLFTAGTGAAGHLRRPLLELLAGAAHGNNCVFALRGGRGAVGYGNNCVFPPQLAQGAFVDSPGGSVERVCPYRALLFGAWEPLEIHPQG
eukprot:gene16999-biopygen20332